MLQLLKPGHVITECPENKCKPSTSKKPYKKKTFKATWDSESDSDEEVDTTNVCFMENDNTLKVFLEPSLEHLIWP